MNLVLISFLETYLRAVFMFRQAQFISSAGKCKKLEIYGKNNNLCLIETKVQLAAEARPVMALPEMAKSQYLFILR